MKYDHFANYSAEEQEDITKQVRCYYPCSSLLGSIVALHTR